MTDNATCEQLRALLNQQIASMSTLQAELGNAMQQYNSLVAEDGSIADPAQFQSVGNLVWSIANRISELQAAIGQTTSQMGAARCM
jgi:hypothetical protein